MFKNVLKIQPSKQPEQTDSIPELDLPLANSTISPLELEQAIINPQVDPLVGVLVTRLLQKNKWKFQAQKDEDDTAPIATQSYDAWNEALGKKFSVMFKNHMKFKQRFLKTIS